MKTDKEKLNGRGVEQEYVYIASQAGSHTKTGNCSRSGAQNSALTLSFGEMGDVI